MSRLTRRNIIHSSKIIRLVINISLPWLNRVNPFIVTKGGRWSRRVLRMWLSWTFTILKIGGTKRVGRWPRSSRLVNKRTEVSSFRNSWEIPKSWYRSTNFRVRVKWIPITPTPRGHQQWAMGSSSISLSTHSCLPSRLSTAKPTPEIHRLPHLGCTPPSRHQVLRASTNHTLPWSENGANLLNGSKIPRSHLGTSGKLSKIHLLHNFRKGIPISSAPWWLVNQRWAKIP